MLDSSAALARFAGPESGPQFPNLTLEHESSSPFLHQIGRELAHNRPQALPTQFKRFLRVSHGAFRLIRLAGLQALASACRPRSGEHHPAIAAVVVVAVVVRGLSGRRRRLGSCMDTHQRPPRLRSLNLTGACRHASVGLGSVMYTAGCQQRSIGSARIVDAIACAPTRSASVTRSPLPSSRATRGVWSGTATWSTCPSSGVPVRRSSSAA